MARIKEKRINMATKIYDFEENCEHDWEVEETWGRRSRRWKTEYRCAKCGGKKVIRNLSL